jgi:hypothetical protein
MYYYFNPPPLCFPSSAYYELDEHEAAHHSPLTISTEGGLPYLRWVLVLLEMVSG